MRHIEALHVDDVHTFYINDKDIPEIEEPEDKMVLWVGSLDAAVVIYGMELFNITIQDMRRKDEGTKTEGENVN